MSEIKLKRLEDAIHKTKQEIGEVGDMRPGSLSKQTRKSKGKYGDYWHLSYTHRGKGHTQYIRNASVAQAKMEVANFKRFRKLVDQLVNLSIERSQFKTREKQT